METTGYSRSALARPETAEPLSLVVDGVRLEGRLCVPERAWGLVVMPQPLPEGHAGPRQAYLARLTRGIGVATLVCDLVGTDAAERGVAVMLNAARLADRLVAWLEAARARADLAGLPVALLAPGVAAASAVIACARRPELARTIVTHAGRADLAPDALRALTVPILMIVGGDDAPALRLNRHALGHVRSVRRLEVVDGARNQFAEPGALGRVAVLARRWLRRYLRPAAAQDQRPPVVAPAVGSALISRL